jgi:excinuclease ABC subunit C
MDLQAKIRSLPTSAGVYLYKNAEGEVIYVGKANNLRSRVSSYFRAGRWEDAKTDSLLREAVDVDYIVVANNKEALALENHLIKQKQPRFNILLRDDKTYPYVKLTLGERFPRVYVTRRLRKDGSSYYGPYFPANLAYRIVDLIHRHFMVPSCKVDLTRYHPRPCLQYYIKRCLGPCVEGLTTSEIYQEAVRDVKLFLEGRPTDLLRSLRQRMELAAQSQEYERAAKYRDLISTVEQLQEKQRIASVEGDDADVFGYHFENGMLAVNLFHMRGGRVLDRREFFWEDLPETATDDVGAVPSPAKPQNQHTPSHCKRRARTPIAQLNHLVPFIPVNSFRPCSSSFTSASLTFRGTYTFRWILTTGTLWKTCSPSRWRARAPAPHESISWCRIAGTSGRSSIWPATTQSNPTTSVFG